MYRTFLLMCNRGNLFIVWIYGIGEDVGVLMIFLGVLFGVDC